MDNITQKAKFSLEAFKEPRGFIKFISFILAIFAFATISSHSTESKFLVKCEGASSNKTVTYSYGYHYALSLVKLDQDVPLCNASATPGPAYLIGDYSSSAQFFVFVGVIGFLISLAYIIIYTLFDEFYMSSDFMPKIDLVLLAVWTLLWLVSSSAWADGLSHVKYYTDPANPWLKEVVPDCANSINQCYPVESGNFATANVSVMFGFLCMFVWGGSVWFVMKETSWFKDRFGGSTAQQQQQQFPSSSQGPSTSSGQASGPYSSYPNRM